MKCVNAFTAKPPSSRRRSVERRDMGRGLETSCIAPLSNESTNWWDSPSATSTYFPDGLFAEVTRGRYPVAVSPRPPSVVVKSIRLERGECSILRYVWRIDEISGSARYGVAELPWWTTQLVTATNYGVAAAPPGSVGSTVVRGNELTFARDHINYRVAGNENNEATRTG